jgi:hypothetical protein
MGSGRRLAVLGTLLLAIGTQVGGYPRTAKPAFGLRQLREFETSDNGRRMTLDFAHDDLEVPGRRIEVNYDVEMAPHIRPHNTDENEHLVSVLASADGKMRLVFDSAAAAAAFDGDLTKGDLLHGHYQDGPGEKAAVFPYHARVLLVKLRQETLHLDFDIPTLSEVFINAKARVLVALAPEDYSIFTHDGDEQEEGAAPVEEMEEAESSFVPLARRRKSDVTRRQLGAIDWAKTWVSKNLQHIAKLGDYVLGVMDVVLKAVDFALTGDLAGGLIKKIDLFAFNYDKATSGPICSFNLEENLLPAKEQDKPQFWGECRKCYAYATVALRFEIDIVEYKVNRVVAMIDGKVDFNMLMDELFIPSGGFIGGYKKLIKGIRTTNGIDVPLGNIGLNIGAYVPVTLGVDMWLSGAATFSVDMSASATVRAGYRYVKDASPQQQMVFKVDYDFLGTGVRMLRWAGREVGMRLSLLPVVQLELSLGAGPLKGMAYIGGPNFGLETSVAAMVTASSSTTAVVTRTISMEGTIGSNTTLRLGGEKSTDLLFGQGKVKPKGILSKEYPLGKDQVIFRPFTAPTSPRRLLQWTEESTAGMDNDTGLIDAPEPLALEAVQLQPRPEWTSVGTTYAGTLKRLKPDGARGCSDEDLGGVIPPYLDVNAVVIDYRSVPGGGFLDAALTFSYGKTEFSTRSGELGSFAAISQGVYTFSLYFSGYRQIPSSCDGLSLVNALMGKTNPSSYPGIDYVANTTRETIDLPRMIGGFCEDGNKMKLFDTMNCIGIVLDRIGTTTTISTRRQALNALPNDERRRKLGHMDRFPRILQQCAPPKPTTPSVATTETTSPESSAAASLAAEDSPTSKSITATSTLTPPEDSGFTSVSAPELISADPSTGASSSGSGVPGETWDSKSITPDPIADASASDIDFVAGATDKDLAIDGGDTAATGADMTTEPAQDGDYVFGPGETQVVELISEENYTKPPTTKKESTDDDFYFEALSMPSATVDDANASERPSWLKYGVGLGASVFSIVGLITWLRKKWRAVVALRTRQAAQTAQV